MLARCVIHIRNVWSDLKVLMEERLKVQFTKAASSTARRRSRKWQSCWSCRKISSKWKCLTVYRCVQWQTRRCLRGRDGKKLRGGHQHAESQDVFMVKKTSPYFLHWKGSPEGTFIVFYLCWGLMLAIVLRFASIKTQWICIYLVKNQFYSTCHTAVPTDAKKQQQSITQSIIFIGFMTVTDSPST